jgi:folate-dependent phosphoribosylglycinamide formyltransferase PurN
VTPRDNPVEDQDALAVDGGSNDHSCRKPGRRALVERQTPAQPVGHDARGEHRSEEDAGRGERMAASPVKLLAQKHGIQVHQPERLKEEIWKEIFQQIHADAFVVVAFGKILPRWLLEIPPLGAFNLHASLLPKYRGAAPVQWAIANGERETGVTTMRLDEGMDTGDILLQEKILIFPHETAVEMQWRLAEIGADLSAAQSAISCGPPSTIRSTRISSSTRCRSTRRTVRNRARRATVRPRRRESALAISRTRRRRFARARELSTTPAISSALRRRCLWATAVAR